MLIGATFVFIGSELSFYFFGNSKSAELAENSFSTMLIVEVPLFILLKNFILHNIVINRIAPSNRKLFKKHGSGICIFSLVYWISITSFIVIRSESISYPGNVFMAAAVVFGILMLIYNLTLRKRLTFKNIVFNKKRFAVITSAVVLISGFTFLQCDTWYTQSYINSVPVVEHNTHNRKSVPFKQ